jgi:hypothetical protein
MKILLHAAWRLISSQSSARMHLGDWGSNGNLQEEQKSNVGQSEINCIDTVFNLPQASAS